MMPSAVIDRTRARVAPRAGGLHASIKPARLRVLHLVLSIGETSAPYNEHCLPGAAARDIAVCTYFPCPIVPPSSIAVIAGDGSIGGFRRALRTALARGYYDILHAHSPHVALLALLFMGAEPGLRGRTVVTVHDSYQNYRIRNRLLFLPVFASFAQVVCCSYASLASFPSVYRWLAGRRLCAVRNGMDIERVDRARARHVPSESADRSFNVLAISRFVPVKSPAVVIEAFTTSAVGDDRLVYIGDGVLRGPLAARVGASPDSARIEFLGLVPRDHVYEHLLRADLFVSASRGEGLPIAVLEAMACGCPVILSDIPPHREIARGADFIPLVSPDDVTGFARAIAAARQMPACERRLVGERCRRLVEQRFSLGAMHDGYSRIYDCVRH